MGKKRGKDKSSTEDEDIDVTGPNCRHIKKGADQGLLKKLVGNRDWTNCQVCKHQDNEEGADNEKPHDSEEEEEETQIPPAVWMCLKCGHRGCGRQSENKHAIKHYETPRSEPHCLVLSMDNWSVWCYICDDEVHYSKTGHLAQLVTNIKKQSTSDAMNRPQKRVKEDGIILMDVAQLTATTTTTTTAAEAREDTEKKDDRLHEKQNVKKEKEVVVKASSMVEDKGGVSVKGLSNLGNTCFFNAVVQNLSQTQFLRQTLNKLTEEKHSISLKPGASTDLEPITVHLAQPGPLTMAMCRLLNEIQDSKRGVVTPQELFTQICRKAPRFKGFQQQDSQELLRYLLDGMRAEEHNRVSTGIMEALKQSHKNIDDERLKSQVKEYEKNGFMQNFVDHVFGGETTSTIMCQQCKTVSVVTEVFLDLSLPLSDEALRKKNQKQTWTNSGEKSQEGNKSPGLIDKDDDGTSGGSSKYQQKKAKKQAKKQAKQQKRQQKLEGRVALNNMPSSPDSQQTDGSTDPSEGKSADSETYEDAPSTNCDVATPMGEPGKRRLNADRTEKKDGDRDSDCESSAGNRFTALSKDQDSKETDNKAEDEELLAGRMEKVSLDDAFIEDSDAAEQSTEAEEESVEDKEYTVVSRDPELAFRTLATRSSPDASADCSVESCLCQFTEVETLTQNNSLLCATCTKRQQSRGKMGGSKNVYTDALKQMLISSPPPVLTLHLKRFKQRTRICKVNRHVQFPFILDMASFCVVKCKNVKEGETQILYRLYGVVEHSGTMRSGHYTAYVKGRSGCTETSSNGLASQGSWFHVSDTSVQPVSESRVQSCQAYLLFYERIH